MPTLMEVAGAAYPKALGGRKILPPEGKSLVPVFRGERLGREKPLFFQWSSGKAVREGRWKLVSRKKGTWELYDMDKDKTETKNLAQQQADIVQRLSKCYDDWYARCKSQSK
jgi:arylsulfatase